MTSRILTVATLLAWGLLPAFAEPWEWEPDQLEAISAFEQKVKVRKKSFHLKTRHWLIETEIDARFTAELGLFMDRFQDVFSQVLRGQSIVARRPTVKIFRHRRDYLDKGGPGTRGYFSYRYDATGAFTEFALYSYLGDDGPDFSDFPQPILLHEGTHALLQKYLGPTRIPSWFTEGLAAHFESWDLRDDAAANVVRCREATSRRVRRSFGPGPAIPLTEVLALDHAGWNPDQGGPVAARHYAASAALIDFLLSSPERKQLMVEIFGRLAAGMASNRVLGQKEIAALEPAWRAHWSALVE